MSEEHYEREAIREAATEETRESLPSEPLIQERYTGHRQRRGYRSLFWPVILVGVGALWLMTNLGVISPDSLLVLVRVWPIFLIVIGLDLLVGRESPILSGLVGLLAVGAMIGVVLIGPSLGWADDVTFFEMPVMTEVEVRHGVFDAALGNTQNAKVNLDLSLAHTSVQALDTSSDRLITADVDYLGDFYLEVQEGRSAAVDLGQDFNVVSWRFPTGVSELRWDIGLNPNVDLDLYVDVGAGSATLDLSELSLADLNIDGGAGSTDLSLPAARYSTFIDVGAGSFSIAVPPLAHLDMVIEGGSGSVQVDVEQDTNADVTIDGSSGSFTFNIPDNTGVQVIVEDSGSGSVHIPSDYQQVQSGSDDIGEWKSAGFSSAQYVVVITVEELGSGSVHINH